MCSQGGKDHLFIRDEMDIMDYPAGIVETVLRVKKKWQLHLDHVVSLQAGKVAAEERNWKQCASKKADGRFGGLIKVSRRQFPGEGGYSWEFLVGVCCAVPQILIRFHTKKCNFPRPFSD